LKNRSDMTKPEPTYNKILRNEIKEILKREGESRKELAKQTGWSRQYIWQLLSGRRKLNMVVLDKFNEIVPIKTYTKEEENEKTTV